MGHGNTDGHESRGERAARRTAGRSGKRGRPATASPDDVLALVTELYLDGQRVDITVVAARLGLGRATIYRWFGSREALLGEVIARQLELLVARKRAEVRRRGAAGLLEVLDRVNRTLTRSRAVRRLLESGARQGDADTHLERRRGRAAGGRVRAGADRGGDGGRRYEPPADPATLAYALVHLRHAFLWNDATSGVRGDYERLREVSGRAARVSRARRRRRSRRGPGASPPSAPTTSWWHGRGGSACEAPLRGPSRRRSRRPDRRPTRRATAGRAARTIARTPPWIPLGHTSMAPISTTP